MITDRIKYTRCNRSDRNIFFSVLVVPDDLVLQLLNNRLAQLDAVTNGWVIHGFPKTREQAESLAKAGYEPNRYKAFSCGPGGIFYRGTFSLTRSLMVGFSCFGREQYVDERLRSHSRAMSSQ